MIYFITCSLIWGLTWFAIQFQFGAVDSNVAVFYRFAFSSLVLFLICVFRKERILFRKSDHLRFFSQGFFMFCLNYLLTYWASHLAPSALVALAFTALIYFNMFGARLFLGVPFESKVIWGALVSLLGMGFISYNEVSSLALHPTSIIGFFISLVATLSASAGNLISSRSRQNNVGILSNNSWSMLYGSIMCLIWCVAQQRSFALSLNKNFVISFLYLSVFGTIISFWAYIKLIELWGPAKAAFTSVVSPILAVIVSLFFENLQITGYLMIGIALCLVGNTIALVKRAH